MILKNWGNKDIIYNAGDVIISGCGMPIGIAMNDAKKGETVSVVMNGIFSVPVEKESEEYKVPTINLEVPIICHGRIVK